MATYNPIEQKEQIDLSYMGSRDEQAETRTVASRKRLREQMQSEIEAFLISGGKIQEVEASKVADLPNRPSSNYGSHPI